jgi:peroxiredoxin
MRQTTLRRARTRWDSEQKVRDFILTDSHGRLVRLQNLLNSGPVVISFYPGGWCAYCNVALCDFQVVRSQVELTGASLLAISPELPYHARMTEQRNKLTLLVLIDVRNVVA